MGKITHGHSPWGKAPSPEYRAYHAMRNRCLNPNQARYRDYGGRGITICDRWLSGDGARSGFECFLADVGPRPSPRHTIDRRENDRGYEPGNVRWATRVEQARNMRGNRQVEIDGERLQLAEAVERFASVPYGTVVMRLHRGWSDRDAVLTPKGGKPSTAITRAAERVTVCAA